MNTGLAIQTMGLVLLCVGLVFSYAQHKPTLFSYFANVKGIYNDIKGDNYFQKPRIEIKPLEINIPNSNPEIGLDSEYVLNIITPHPITKFLLKVRAPNSLWEPEEMFSLYNNPIGGESTWYSYKIKNGYATFEIPNAAGEYHLTFGNLKPEKLTINDISW